ncbi:hypothetical protein [Bacillus altitudinis]|uniref:hypothetical protein n=1 Tax=Bacillus altitudinis TaxID=293387 RepID=UPI0011A5A58C|nr:hypothetical protein [Bacillus altitudinis]
MRRRGEELYDGIYEQTEKQDEEVLRVVKEMREYGEGFCEEEKEKMNGMEIVVERGREILENLMRRDREMTIVLREGRIGVEVRKA